MSQYQDCLTFLFAQLPMFQRIGQAAFKKDLTNIRKLCDALGNPQQQFKVIHVAGTNGKGSVSHILAAVLQASGYRVGLYTSPHYQDFRERIKVNGAYIPEHEVVTFVEAHKHWIDDIRPSFFEWTVAMAFAHFASEKVDAAVVETGLGGRLDSTNIVDPVLSVITNISFDHQEYLGDHLAAIAREKAGIIKPRVPVVIGERQAESTPVFLEVSTDREASLTFADTVLEVDALDELDSGSQRMLINWKRHSVWKPCSLVGLSGAYQSLNVRTALAALWTLQQSNYFSITSDALCTGLMQVRSLTNMQGRWQVLQQDPLVIADSAHNEAGVQYVVRQLMAFKGRPLKMVLGFVKDKKHESILTQLPVGADYYWCAAQLPRALPAEELQSIAKTYGLHGNSYASVRQALDAALSDAQTDDVIFVGGSIFVVAEILPA